MRAIIPIKVDETNTTSNVAITESEWTPSTYGLGTQKYEGTTLYEVIVTNTAEQPSVGVLQDPPSWKEVGAIGRFKMFDGVEGTQSTNTVDGEVIEVTVESGSEFITDLAFLNLDGSSLTVTMEVGGSEVYNEEYLLQDNTGIVDWYYFFFSDVKDLKDLVATDVPSYSNATVSVTLANDFGEVKSIGEMVLGRSKEIGETQFDTRMSINDFSIKERDEEGNSRVVEGKFIKEISYAIMVEDNKVASTFKFLQQYRATPLVWIGEDTRTEMITYGFIRDFEIILTNPAYSTCSLVIEGL